MSCRNLKIKDTLEEVAGVFACLIEVRISIVIGKAFGEIEESILQQSQRIRISKCVKEKEEVSIGLSEFLEPHKHLVCHPLDPVLGAALHVFDGFFIPVNHRCCTEEVVLVLEQEIGCLDERAPGSCRCLVAAKAAWIVAGITGARDLLCYITHPV